jgi:hypothetical protein
MKYEKKKKFITEKQSVGKHDNRKPNDLKYLLKKKLF